MEKFYIAISRFGQSGQWTLHTDCLTSVRRLADNYCEILSATHPERQYRVGETVILEQEAPRNAPNPPVKSYEDPLDHAHIQE